LAGVSVAKLCKPWDLSTVTSRLSNIIQSKSIKQKRAAKSEYTGIKLVVNKLTAGKIVVI